MNRVPPGVSAVMDEWVESEAMPAADAPELAADADSPAAGADVPVPEARRVRASGWELLLCVALLMVLAFGVYQPVRVEGTSMLPVLEDQDRLFINKFAYSGIGSMVGESVHRGDVVVFEYPRDKTKSYIKRVIALPGDTILIEHGLVYVNDELLKEPYVPAKYADERSQPEMMVATGTYFVMGDHRSISSDSRDFGSVPRELIYGRAAFVYWPVDQAGIVH